MVHPPHISRPGILRNGGPAWTGILARHAPESMAGMARNCGPASAGIRRPAYLGEFGAYDKAPQEDRVKYTAAVARAAEKRGWAFGYWQFDSNFVVYDIDKDAWNEPIYRALVPR